MNNSHKRLKFSTLSAIGMSHFLLLWFIWHVEVKSPAVTPFPESAVQVRFIRMKEADSQKESIARTQKKTNQSQTQQKTEKLASATAMQKTVHVEIMNSTYSKKIAEVQSKQQSRLPAQKKPASSPAQSIAESHQPSIEQAFRAVKAEAVAEQADAGQSKDQIAKHSGGDEGRDEQKEQVAASVSVQPAYIAVSRVDVLSFGKLNYDDRELQNQQRILILTIKINAKGQPIEIRVKQSSGIASLDERGKQAAQKAKFKPHKINGEAVPIVVDFPIQLKPSRSR